LTVSVLSGVGRGALWARLESPRGHYATPDLATAATRAPRRRQLPTNHGHVALPCGVIHVYQSDSSSKPPHRQPRAGALRNSLTQIRGPSSATHKKPLDVGPSISVSTCGPSRGTPGRRRTKGCVRKTDGRRGETGRLSSLDWRSGQPLNPAPLRRRADSGDEVRRPAGSPRCALSR